MSPVVTQQERERQTLTIMEAAHILGVSERHLYELCRRGEFPAALSLGGRWVIPTARLEAMLNEGWRAGEQAEAPAAAR